MKLSASNLKSAQARVGKCPEGNCWGMTAFVLGWRSRHYFMSEGLMARYLRGRLREIHKPRRFRLGDVVAKFDWCRTVEGSRCNWEGCAPELMHTAVYAGKGLWMHQTGHRGSVRLHKFATMIRCYNGRTRYYRA